MRAPRRTIIDIHGADNVAFRYGNSLRCAGRSTKYELKHQPEGESVVSSPRGRDQKNIRTSPRRRKILARSIPAVCRDTFRECYARFRTAGPTH